MRLLKLIVFVLFICFNINAEENHQLTVSDLYNDPGLSRYKYREKNIIWTPDGKCVAYFENIDTTQIALLRMNARSKTIDTIFVSSQLLWFGENDTIKMDHKNYKWSPVGNKLLLRGEKDLFIYNIEEKSLDRVTTDKDSKSDVKFSPDAKWLSYIKNHDIWITKIDTKENLQLTKDGNDSLYNGELDWVYPEELDIRSGYQWSPDSRNIAFMQMDESNVPKFPIPDWTNPHPDIYWEYYPKAGDQNPEVRLGIIDISEDKVVWINLESPDIEYIPRFDWLPNSETLAVQTLNRGQNHLKLYFVNTVSGDCRLILEEKDPYWLNITDLYYFFKNRENFIWYSEQDGFMHLYLYNYEGNIIEQLTKGKWCVTELNDVDEKKEIVYFTSTKESVLERHIYSLSLKTKKVIKIDKGKGTHSGNFSPLFHYYIERFSRIDIPTKLYLTSVKGKKVKVLFQNDEFDKDKYGFGTTRFKEITAEDGATLYCSLLYPRDFDPKKKYPVLIYVYGGPHTQLVCNRFVNTWYQLLAQRGYLVFALDNRGSYGRGRDWERKIYLQLGKCELQDQLAGVNYLKSLNYVDSDRIGIWGWSYGGYMTLYSLCKAPDIFKTGIAVAPVTDWKYYDSIYTERYMGLPKDNTLGYKKSAPLNFVEQLKANFLLVHGMADDNVHFQQSASFINELIKYNKHFQFMTYPRRKHGISDKDARIHLFETMTKFIEENL